MTMPVSPWLDLKLDTSRNGTDRTDKRGASVGSVSAVMGIAT